MSAEVIKRHKIHDKRAEISIIFFNWMFTGSFFFILAQTVSTSD